MFTSLLVGLDGSVAAQVALAQAIMIGQRFRARVLLAHVVSPGAVQSLGAPWMEWPADQLPNTGERASAVDELLRDAAGAVRRAGLEAETLTRVGDVSEILRELSERVGVVLVGRAAKRTDGDAVGPDTRGLIRRSLKPVLVCGRVPSQMDRCLVAYDGGLASEGALDFASRFAGIAEAHLDIVHVAANEEEGRALLARASGMLSRTPVSFETHLVTGDPDTAIPEAARRLGSNGLFCGAHREEHGWLVPSNTEAILRGTEIPVLVHMPLSTPGARASAAHRRPSP